MRYDAGREARVRLEVLGSVALICLSASIATAPDAGAQVSGAQKVSAANAQAWKQLQASDARVRASQNRWLRLVTRLPQTGVDMTRQEEQAAEQARQRGAGAVEIQKAREEAQRRGKEMASGTTQTAKLEIIHQFPRTRCVVLEYLPVPTGTPYKTKPFSLVWGTFDGKNAITVEAIDKMTPYIGTISRDPQRILWRSVPSAGHRIFLSASPITKYFAASDIVQNTANEFILQRNMPGPVPMKMRLTVTKRIWRPERMDVLLADGRLNARYEARGYKRFANGILLPERVVVSLFGRKKVVSIYDHKLQSAVFNTAANSKLIDQAIPKGATIIDGRFGRGVPYRSKGGTAPIDSKVRSLMEKQQTARAQSQAQVVLAKQTDTNDTAPQGLLLGGLLMSGGIGLWFRSRGQR